MKGIILAGGDGTRLYPLTKGVSKQLLPVYDKPMIYYPLSVLMLAGIQDILIISTPQDLPNFKNLFGNGSEIGLRLYYKEQPKPEGIAQAFILGEDFIENDDVCLILGDNIFFGYGFSEILKNALNNISNGKPTIFTYYVSDTERYGIAEFDSFGNVISIEEKPQNSNSNNAVVGLYFYTNEVIEIAKSVTPSERGELEITSVNQVYLRKNQLKVQILGRGFTWLDTGTHESLMQASQFIETIEKRQGLKIACIEEVAYRMGYIDVDQLKKIAETINVNSYKTYLLDLIE